MGFKDRFKKVFGQDRDETIPESEVESSQDVNVSRKVVDLPSNGTILFVCMGNVVLSPICEAIFNENAGVMRASSAGLMASEGEGASDDAIEVCANHGIDISGHRSRNITNVEVNDFDLILAVTEPVRDFLRMKYPELNIFTIREYAEGYDDLDIADPFGGDFTDYEKCFRQLEEAILRILEAKTVDGEAVVVKNFRYLDDLIHSGIREIVFDSDIVFDDDLNRYREGITIDVDDILIDGADHTIDGAGKARIFDVEGKNVTIKNLTLKNGFSYFGGGGAIENTGDLTLQECIFENNLSDDDGGALSSSTDLKAIRCKFLNNVSRGSGGAIISMARFRNDVEFSRCTFSNNASDKSGAAVYLMSGGIKLKNSIFTSNRCCEGGIVHTYSQSIKIFDCRFFENVAEYIISNECQLQCDNSVFRNNECRYIISNRNPPKIQGFEDDANFSMYHCEFLKNTADCTLYNEAKDCYIEKTIFETGLITDIYNLSDLTLNDVAMYGEGRIVNENHILLESSAHDLSGRIQGGVVEGIEVPGEEKSDFGHLDRLINENAGGEIVLDGDICLEDYEKKFYEGGIVLDVDGMVIDGAGCTIDGAEKSRIFLITAENVTIKNITFKNGHSFYNYDNIRNNNGGAVKINRNSRALMENCRFMNCSSDYLAGAIKNRGSLHLEDCTFSENSAKFSGGAIMNDGGLKLSRCVFSNNVATGAGAIFTRSPELIDFSTCSFEANLPDDIEENRH